MAAHNRRQAIDRSSSSSKEAAPFGLVCFCFEALFAFFFRDPAFVSWSASFSTSLSSLSSLSPRPNRIVSKAKHNTAKREQRLVKAGYLTRKGHFGFVKKGSKSRRSSKRGSKKGGALSPLSPTSYDGEGSGTSGVNLQFVAGNAA